MLDVILKRFEQPDEVREMIKGTTYVSLHFLGADSYAR